MLEFWYITWVAIKILAKGFMMGVFLRMIVAIFTKGDCSVGGFIRTGLVTGVLYFILMAVYILR